MLARDADILIVPGLGGSGPDHWQSRWQGQLQTARRVGQEDWDRPDRSAWRDRIVEAVEAARKPPVLVAHSLGVISAVDALSSRAGARVAGAFLVAPPDPADAERRPAGIADFAPVWSGRLPCPSFLVASRNDPYGAYSRAEGLAVCWGSLLFDAAHAGHINADSGHGPWPEGLLLFARLLRNLPGELQS